MRKRDKLFVLKYCLNVLNGVFLLFGLLLVAFGLWILLDSNIFFTLLLSTGEHSLALFSHLLLVTGSITVFSGILGCLGSLREIRCLVAVYMGLLLLLLGIQSTILVLLYTRQEMLAGFQSFIMLVACTLLSVVLCLVATLKRRNVWILFSCLLSSFWLILWLQLFADRKKIHTLWRSQLDELISTYGNKNRTEKEHQWAILDDFQHTVHCCGRHNITDWNLNEYKEHANQVPCSCTTIHMKQWFCDALKNAIYIRGCEEDTKMWFEQNIWVLSSINSGLLSIEVLQFLIAAWLLRLTKKTQVFPKN